MQRYYFNLRLGSRVLHDEDGREFADLLQARQEARAAMHELMQPRNGREQSAWFGDALQVVNEEGEILEIPFPKAAAAQLTSSMLRFAGRLRRLSFRPGTPE